MKTTTIVKGKVVKEEECEFAFSHHSLNQIEVHISNTEGSYSIAQLIHDVVSYDPSTVNNAQLADDMRICFAWYSTIKEGFSDVKERVKKFKFSEQDAIRLAKDIYTEIEKRKREGKMEHEWNPEEMKKHSKTLFGIISKGQSLQTPLTTNENGEVNSNVSTELLDAKDQGCGKAWEVLFAEGMAVQYFEVEDDANYFGDSVNKCSTYEGFAKDVIHVKHSFVHRHSKTKRCYSVNKKGVKFKCSRKELELDPEIKNWFRNNLPIYPGEYSNRYPSLELSEFLDKWNTFTFKKPFISLVGSLANWGRTEGDIDILIKARDPAPLLEALDRATKKCFQIDEEQMADVLIQVSRFIHTDSLFLAAQWRIERALLEWSGRLHILDDSFSGPFTNFVEIADLVAASREEKERKEMAQLKKLKLFEWFSMLKPIHGRKKEEIYSVYSVIETIKSRKEDWFETGVYVEKKFDGVHCQAHKNGNSVRIWTEDETEITMNCPSLVKELSEKKGNFIICGEEELWKEGKHQPRADCAGVLNSKEVHPDENCLRFNIFDILWHAGNDIHDSFFSERIEHLNQIADTEHVKKGKRVLCHSEAEVRKAIEKVSKEEGSEGAYLKKADFKYELDGKTLNNIKFKNELSCEVQIVKVNIVKERK